MKIYVNTFIFSEFQQFKFIFFPLTLPLSAASSFSTFWIFFKRTTTFECGQCTLEIQLNVSFVSVKHKQPRTRISVFWHFSMEFHLTIAHFLKKFSLFWNTPNNLCYYDCIALTLFAHFNAKVPFWKDCVRCIQSHRKTLWNEWKNRFVQKIFSNKLNCLNVCYFCQFFVVVVAVAVKPKDFQCQLYHTIPLKTTC